MARSILRTAFNRVVEARRREADRVVSRALLTLDDKTLSALGKDRQELRRKASNGYLFW